MDEQVDATDSAEHEWLLIYDNVDDINLLMRYWPVASHGAIIVTSRNHSLGFEPADRGLEVPHFDAQEGSDFLMFLLQWDLADDISSTEVDSALQLSQKLSGHALALAQMAGLIVRRSWSIKQFLAVYEKNARKLHGQFLDIVWHMSFESLDDDAKALLGVLSSIAPDAIPEQLLEVEERYLPATLSCCTDELR